MTIRFKQFVEVRNPPWEGLDYYRKKAQDLKALEDELAGLPQLVEKVEKVVRDFCGNTAWYQASYDLPYWLMKHVIQSDNRWSSPTYAQRLSEFLEWFPRMDWHERGRHFENLAKAIGCTKQDYFAKHADWVTKRREIIRSLPDVLDCFETNREYFRDGKHGDPDEDYPAYAEAVEMLKKATDGVTKLGQYALILFDIQSKTQAQLERRHIAYERQFHRFENPGGLPPHKPQEILYHATMAISAIQREGFRTKDQTGAEGLGGGPADVLCFTSEFVRAKSIAQAIKEAVLIAKGQIRYEDIMAWMRQHGLDASKLESMTRQVLSSTDSPEDRTMKYYRSYLFLAGEAGVRDNPVFWGADADKYRNINLQDVGVVAARVDMSQVKDYLGAEEEYRVPPAAVLKVLRVWRA